METIWDDLCHQADSISPPAGTKRCWSSAKRRLNVVKMPLKIGKSRKRGLPCEPVGAAPSPRFSYLLSRRGRRSYRSRLSPSHR
ncbi:MAG: hypothetical protein U9Q71_03440 [Pseudomonadota bacterium]|nr:hypothetical protein [Pseudomonadota bacterium]